MQTRFIVRRGGFCTLVAIVLASAGCQSPPSNPSKTAPPQPTSAAEKTAPAAPPAPAPAVVTRGSLKRSAQLDAVVEAVTAHPLRLEPKAWMDLTVIEAKPHGARVKTGDVLLKLDTKKLREQIEDIELDRPGAALALELAQAELENLTRTTPQKLDAARRTARIAAEDRAFFREVNRERREKASKFNVKSAEQRLSNATEELKQLESMYKADDLVETTEEIVIARQRFEVEGAQFTLENTRIASERELNTIIPRESDTLENGQRDQELALKLAEATLPTALARKQFEVEKQQRDQRKAAKRLDDLKSDLKRMSVKAPCDGMVLYGACEGGKWPTSAALSKKLVSGGKIMPLETFMTVVNPDALQLRGVVPEPELSKFAAGMTGEAVPVSAPGKKLAVTLERLDPVPLPTGGFDATLSLPAGTAPHLLPGMSCKVTLKEGPQAKSLLAPAEAVFTENGQTHVFVILPDGKPEKRTVRVGESDGKATEILEGVAEGDKLLPKKP
ncbi:MAG TPA: hypothetical protein PKM73_14940 [Verrucomicrobiota bacterium]|nr:hypothetical protein [Verrucomicrobiota bacterium]HNU52634.1 hypothetical protein [Verrucomicrobiota bacterium]